ncbi:site-specific DNA-methyltransferase [Endozoicomonas atrinae]|uniref:site-specific DNA-methyltransferase n=1 Tax=Endozoicomonas atrinae TaxID=1333660 RepID=UPI003B00CAC6
MARILVESIEHRSVASLIPYANNARTHSDEQVTQIARSIEEFGFVNPVLVGSDDVIVAGHGRLMAARQLGMETVPVIVLGHLTETQRRALVIADNQITANSGWDEDLLKQELAELDALDFDLDLMGFSDEELEGLLLLDEPEGQTDDDEIPEPEEHPVSQAGDLWVLGDHRVLCGSATEQTDVETLMAGQLADMVFTDPPYNVDYANPEKNGKAKKDRRIKNDNLGTEFYTFLLAAMSNLLGVCKGAIYICMSSSELDTLQKSFREAGGKWSTFIIWAKNTFTLGRSDYQRQYEPILYGWKEGSEHFWCGARDQGDVWYFNKPARNDLHPTMKPVELVERAIRNSSKTRDIILDLFGGSGSTLIACEKSHRSARLMELDPKYVDVIVRRWEEFSGKEAYLESNQLTFEQNRDDRHGRRKCLLAEEEKEAQRHGRSLAATGSD